MDVRSMFRTAQASGLVKHYKKFGTVTARPGVPGETVTTVIDGETETVNTAGVDDMVITGSKNERYITSRAKFITRYDPVLGQPGVYVAKGECWAFEVPADTPEFSFDAPWGEKMLCKPGDFIATPQILDPLLSDIYRIERGAFDATYRKA